MLTLNQKQSTLIKKVFLLFVFIIQFTLLKAQSIDDKIAEVYGDVNGNFFRGNTELYSTFQGLLQNRVRIEEMPYETGEKFPKISTLPLMNKYNTSLSHTPFLNAQSFNPLKYNMEFFAKSTKVYRIDNTNLIIVIDPQ
jgi:hypothetical protein